MTDIYIVGFVFFLLVAAYFFNKSFKLRSQGYLLLGIASVLFSLVILLIKFDNNLYILLLIIAFVLDKIGLGILSGKERKVYAAFSKQPSFWKRLFGIFPPEAIQEMEKSETERTKIKNQRFLVAAGVLSVIMGGLGVVWREEKIFPIILIVIGVVFIFMGMFYNKQRQTKDS